MEKLCHKVSQYTYLRADTHRHRGGRGKMFRENTTHLQTSFFDIERQLSERKKKKIRESEELQFLSTNIQEDKRGKLCRIVFRKRKPAELGGKCNGIGDNPCL